MVNLGLIILFSCKKGDQGLQGETGPKGEQGEKGATGVQGAKGADGATIFSGDGVPAATLGQNGDYYIRKSTSEMYGPKTDAGWGKATSFKGATGANGTNGTNGAAGTKILSGTAIPAVSLGAIGDFYFKTDSYQLFGPKIASGWGTGVNLKGATGSANVVYSGWQLASSYMRDSTIDATNIKVRYIPAPLTTDLLAKGVVMVYMDYGGGTFPLPYTSLAAGKASTITFQPIKNKLAIYRITHDGTNSINLSSLIRYRYVIIPGGVMASLKRKGIDLNDFSRVEMALKAE